MKIWLTQFTVNGIKGIYRPLSFPFAHQNIRRPYQRNIANTKVIYGENGSGKSAVLAGLAIYQQIMHQPHLSAIQQQAILAQVNHQTQRITIIVEILAETGKKSVRYQHTLVLRNNKRKVFFDQETLLRLTGNGQVDHSYFNVTNQTELTYALWRQQHVQENVVKHWDFFIQNIYIMNEQKPLFWQCKVIPFAEDAVDVVIKSKDLKEFQDFLQDFLQLLQLFKSDVKTVKIHRKYYHHQHLGVTLTLVYPYGNVLFSQESAGFRRLLPLMMAFKALQAGYLVVIDELDSHLNDIYLSKLIEYAMNYGQGQLLFTAHSITPMEVLKAKRYSIDVITQHCEVFHWVKQKNRSLTKIYQEGYIGQLPFNLQATDFIAIFGLEQ